MPGPNAALLALTLSGLPPHPFLFLGFLPPKAAARRAALARLRAAERAGLAATLLFHEAPHRLAEALADMADLLGPRPAAVARELTKRFEEVARGTLPELAARYAARAAARRGHAGGRPAARGGSAGGGATSMPCCARRWRGTA